MVISDLLTKQAKCLYQIYSEDKEYISQNQAPKTYCWAEGKVLKSSALISSARLSIVTVDCYDVWYAQKLINSKPAAVSTFYLIQPTKIL